MEWIKRIFEDEKGNPSSARIFGALIIMAAIVLLAFKMVKEASAAFTGDRGFLGFTGACQSEFPGTRFCDSQEVIQTRTIPAQLEGSAWVNPTSLEATVPNDVRVRDVSGLKGDLDERLARDSAELPDNALATQIDDVGAGGRHLRPDHELVLA